MIKALIFDFDGLILETEAPCYQSWRELFESYGCELHFSTWMSTIGTMDLPFDPLDLLEERLGHSLKRDEIIPRRLERELALIAAQPIMPGVREYLTAAQQLGVKIGLASSSSCKWVTDHLERLGLIAYFECISGGDDVERTKPDPAVYLSALSCLNVQPNQAVALEDSPLGVLAAKRAGLICVAVPSDMTRNLSFDHADLRIESLADMPLDELLNMLNKARRSREAQKQE